MVTTATPVIDNGLNDYSGHDDHNGYHSHDGYNQVGYNSYNNSQGHDSYVQRPQQLWRRQQP